jgi:hypothetical protein
MCPVTVERSKLERLLPLHDLAVATFHRLQSLNRARRRPASPASAPKGLDYGTVRIIRIWLIPRSLGIARGTLDFGRQCFSHREGKIAHDRQNVLAVTGSE